MAVAQTGPGWLFCPADRPERFGKAAAAADVVILDLEDGVAAKDREAARKALVDTPLDPARTVVRVNPVTTADHALDVEALKQSSNQAQSRAQGERLSKATTLAPGQPARSYGYKEAQNYAQQARVVNGRAFYQNGLTWTDATAQTRKDLKQKAIAFNSDDYFALLAQNPDAAQWLSLGNEVDVVLGEELVMVR